MPPACNATPDLPDGAYEKPSQFSGVDALWVDGREIAHVEAQDATGVAYDVRLTRQVIRAQPPDQPDGRRDWRSLTPTPPPPPPPHLHRHGAGGRTAPAPVPSGG